MAGGRGGPRSSILKPRPRARRKSRASIFVRYANYLRVEVIITLGDSARDLGDRGKATGMARRQSSAGPTGDAPPPTVRPVIGQQSAIQRRVPRQLSRESTGPVVCHAPPSRLRPRPV